MPHTLTNPDPTQAAALSPSSPSSPTPDSPLPTPPSHVPALSPRRQELLNAFTAAHFDLLAFAAAAKISSVELANFAAHPDIQAHIDALINLARKSLYLRAVQARHKTITELENLTDTADDHIERRRATTQLLRATSSPITCSFAPSRPDESSRVAHDDPNDKQNDDGGLPAPHARPDTSSLTAQRLADLLIHSLQLNDAAHPEQRKARALATISAFADHGATINGTTIPTDDDEECYQAVESSAVSEAANATHHWRLEDPHVTDTTATFARALCHGYPEERIQRKTRLTLRLERKPNSRHPERWLITAITVEPYAPPRASNTR